jgi:hypothetical protein
MITWGTLAIYFSYLPSALRFTGAGLFLAAAIAVLLLLRPRQNGVMAFLGLFAVVLIGWLSMQPSNGRNWQPDVAVLPYATADGDAMGDERGLIRSRTNYREGDGETVYLYRLQGASLDVARQVFLDYIGYINRLKERPEWYNALTGNCTTQIRGHTRPYAGKVWWDWRILANGYIDELAYELGVVDTSMPFNVLKQQSIINEKARAADQDPAFSRIIRQGRPIMDSPS